MCRWELQAPNLVNWFIRNNNNDNGNQSSSGPSNGSNNMYAVEQLRP